MMSDCSCECCLRYSTKVFIEPLIIHSLCVFMVKEVREGAFTSGEYNQQSTEKEGTFVSLSVFVLLSSIL